MKTKIGHKTATGKRSQVLAPGAYLYASPRKVGFRVRLELKFDNQLHVQVADNIVMELDLDYSERPTSCWVWDRHVKSETTVRSMFKKAMVIVDDHNRITAEFELENPEDPEDFEVATVVVHETYGFRVASLWGAIKSVFVR